MTDAVHADRPAAERLPLHVALDRQYEMDAANASIGGDKLRSFIERLERLDEERRAVSEQFKDVFGEAKSEGYDVGTIRRILSLRKLKPHVRAEADELLEVYKAALGMV